MSLDRKRRKAVNWTIVDLTCRTCACGARETQQLTGHTFVERGGRGGHLSDSTDHPRADGRRGRSGGGGHAFGARRSHGGELLWLVVEGRCGDLEVEGRGHHERLAAAGLLHLASLLSEGGTQTDGYTVWRLVFSL